MTLLELSVDYRSQAERLRARIRALNAACKTEKNSLERERLQWRIRTLSELFREARDLAILTERYYERGYRRNGKYTL